MIYLKTYKDLNENMSKGECDICGEPIFTDNRICDDCRTHKDEIEMGDDIIQLETPPNTLPAFTKSQNVYFENNSFKQIDYNSFEEWVENRTIQEFTYHEKDYIDRIFRGGSFLYEIDYPEVGNINIIINKEGYDDGVGVRICKYNDEYFYVLIDDVYCNDDGSWETDDLFTDSTDFICDQLEGIRDAIRYEIGNSYVLPKSTRKFENYEYENFTAVDMDLVKELYEDGMTDPDEIRRELDFRELSIETIRQIIHNLRNTDQIK